MKDKTSRTKQRFYMLPILMTPALFLAPIVFDDRPSNIQVYAVMVILVALFVIALWVASRFKLKAGTYAQRAE